MEQPGAEQRNYLIEYLIFKRNRRCLICGIVSILSVILWIPAIIAIIAFGLFMWGLESHLYPLSYWLSFLGMIFLPGLISIGTLVYIIFCHLADNGSQNIMKTLGLIFSIFGTVIHVGIWLCLIIIFLG